MYRSSTGSKWEFGKSKGTSRKLCALILDANVLQYKFKCMDKIMCRFACITSSSCGKRADIEIQKLVVNFRKFPICYISMLYGFSSAIYLHNMLRSFGWSETSLAEIQLGATLLSLHYLYCSKHFVRDSFRTSTIYWWLTDREESIVLKYLITFSLFEYQTAPKVLLLLILIATISGPLSTVCVQFHLKYRILGHQVIAKHSFKLHNVHVNKIFVGILLK